jgi:uncharacterized protein YjbI with pentapeptide repeats
VLKDANLHGLKLGAALLNEADLRGAGLGGVDLNGAQLDKALLERAQLDQTDLRGASMRGVDLRHAQLLSTNLGQAKLAGADLSGATVKGARFKQADLQKANFDGVHLEDVSLKEAAVAQASFRNAVFTRVNLCDVDLTHARLDGAKFDQCSYDLLTRWPENYTPPKNAGEEPAQEMPHMGYAEASSLSDLNEIAALSGLDLATKKAAAAMEGGVNIPTEPPKPSETLMKAVSPVAPTEAHQAVAPPKTDPPKTSLPVPSVGKKTELGLGVKAPGSLGKLPTPKLKKPGLSEASESAEASEARVDGEVEPTAPPGLGGKQLPSRPRASTVELSADDLSIMAGGEHTVELNAGDVSADTPDDK